MNVNSYENILFSSYLNFMTESSHYLNNLLFCIGIWISFYITLCLIIYYCSTHQLDHCKESKRTLVVIAHPDDECMFFGPTIFKLCRYGVDVHILCLSDGNYDGKGDVRWKELWLACNTLGIPDKNICLIKDTRLLDDPKLQWPITVVAKLIQNTIEKLDVDMFITFDRGGVSSHSNHTAIFYAVAYLFIKKLMPKSCSVYTLDTVNLLRKYWSFIDLPLSYIMSSKRYVLSWKEHWHIIRAMKCHRSQMLWFRYLYLIFSRYIVINTLHKVDLSDIELELEIDE